LIDIRNQIDIIDLSIHIY